MPLAAWWMEHSQTLFRCAIAIYKQNTSETENRETIKIHLQSHRGYSAIQNFGTIDRRARDSFQEPDREIVSHG